MIQLREKYKYGLVIPTSMGVRMTPLDRQPVHTSNLYMMHYERGIERWEYRRLIGREREAADGVREGQPDRRVHQGRASAAQSFVRGTGGRSGRPLGLPAPV